MNGNKLILTKESDEAKTLVARSKYHPVTRDFLIHNANGGSRHPLEARNLKLQGVRPGVSDYLIPYPTCTCTCTCGGHHGAWIELKRRDKKIAPTADQLIWIHRMKSVGYFAEVAYGADHAWELIMSYLSASNPPQV